MKLVATNSIRGGANRKVLDAIQEQSRIFEAWSDETWVNDGAAVRVSLVCFGKIGGARLNGTAASQIYSDLTASNPEALSLDLNQSRGLPENRNASFQGSQKIGAFDISGEQARQWLKIPNPHSRSNAEVLRPSWNGLDITRTPRDGWIVDFGITMLEAEAALFEAPFQYVLHHVKPERNTNNRESYRKWWWRHGEPRIAMRSALQSTSRYFATSAHAKHFFFVWLPVTVLPDKALIVISRADDTTFGILHSRFHELWSLRMGTSLEDRPRYTPTTCFETFPFPAGLTPLDTAHQRTEAVAGGALIPAGLSESNQALVQEGRPSVATKHIAPRAAAESIAVAAKRLNELREAWLNPPEWTQRVPEVVPLGMETSPYPDRILPKSGHEKELAERTLTKLYNQRPAWLDAAHRTLDLAVAAAYGWADYGADMADEEILKRLLALNLARSGQVKA